MVSSVVLGNFFSANGKTVLGGVGGSGLDTKTLIDSLVQARSFPVTTAQDKITLNGKKSSAFNTFQSLLSNFRSAADTLRNPPGVGNAADNVFKFTTGSVFSDTATPGSSYMSVITSPGATLQSYTITNVDSLATAGRQTSGIFTIDSPDDSVVPPDAGSVAFNPGTITINSQDITIEADDSLGTIAAKFNAVSDTTGVAATIIQIDATHYQLSFTATQTGEDNDFDLLTVTDTDGVFDDLGLNAAIAGTNAEFEINGVAVIRQSNSVSDVINGVTFNLQQKTLGASLTVNIEPDRITVQNSIVNYVQSYNAIRAFAVEQTAQNNDGTYAETAYLATNQTFRNILNEISAQVSGEVAGLSGLSSLATLGITFTTQPATEDSPEISNILTVNDGLLTSQLASNFNNVSKLFGTTFSSTNPNVRIFSSANTVSITSFTLNIDFDAGGNVFEAIYDLGSGPVHSPFTITELPNNSGYSLRGAPGSPLEGLVMLYAGTTDTTATINLTQGVAAKSYNSSYQALDTVSNRGSIALALKELEDNDVRLNSDIERLTVQIDQYRETLLKKFAALEAAISRTNNLLNALNANSDAINNAAS